MIVPIVCFFLPGLLAIAEATASPTPTAHEGIFSALGGLPTLVGAVFGAVVAIPITFAFTKWGVDYAERRSSKREAAHAQEARAAESAELETSARLAAEKRDNVHWKVSAALLRGALFSMLPDEYRSRLIDRIIARFEGITQTTEQLFRTTRLFVEAYLLESAQFGGLNITAESSERAIYARLFRLMDVALKSGSIETVEFETCSKLDALEKSEPNASGYFRTLIGIENTYLNAGIRIKEIDRFLTPIRVNEGFIAPTYVISGLLDQYKGDWQTALSQFNDALGPYPGLSVSVRRFELFRWLLYGVSIPVCRCTRWEGAFTVLQYGFGDESNSFPLILDRNIYAREWERIREELIGFDEVLPFAFGSGFEGSIVWGPRYHLDLNDFPNVFSVKTSKEPERPLRLTYERDRPRRSVFNGLMLRALKLDSLTVRRRYYSAYAWVLFEVVSPDGEPLYSEPSDRWRFLFPLFEEANIADGEALVYFKRRLAEKASKAIRDFESDCVGQRQLRYICAFDDPGTVLVEKDSHEFPLTRHPEHAGTFRNGPRVVAPLPVGKNRLRTLLASELADEPTVTRVFSRPSTPGNVITACDLPDIAEAFYRSYLHAPHSA